MSAKDPSDKMQIRVDYLEKQARRNLYGLDLLASIGELQLNASMARDPERIITISMDHLQRWMGLKSMAFFMVDEDSSDFILKYVEPSESKLDIESEVNVQIDNGTFAWALNQNRPVTISTKDGDNTLILHVLASQSRVRGMFAGLSQENKRELEGTALYILSVIMQSTAHSLESAALYQLVYEQNQNLEETVRIRTQDLEQQTIVLKEEIVNRRLAEESLIIAKDQAEAAARAKSEFLANMSHEIRTPLNAILGFGEILQYECKKLERDDLLEDLKSIESAGRHLLSLINDILDISRIQADKMSLHLEEFNLKPLVEETVSTIRFQANKNANELIVEFVEPVDELMYSDSVRVKQILLNLVSNACKFTSEGWVRIKVWQEKLGDEEFVNFEVSDSGIGIDPEKIDSLFLEFVQADSSTTRKYGGTGLGLPITKRLSELLGGKIRAVSELGKGAKFTATLPLRATSPTITPGASSKKSEDDIAEISENIEIWDDTLDDGSDARERVVAFEEDDVTRGLLKRLVEREGFKVEAAANAEAGLDMIRRHKPLAVALALQGHKLDGWDVLRRLKEDSTMATIPVLALSEEDNIDRATEMGVAAYFRKPVDWEQYISLLNHYRALEKNATILVVEDDEPNRETLQRILSQSGWKVLQAVDGPSALEMIEAEKPALVLLDLMLPEMNGFEVLENIRSCKGCESIPTLILTAKDLTEKERLFLRGKTSGVLKKGHYTKNELLSEIGKLLRAYPG
ncbi:MAG: response regulator [Candidatus Nitrohelix vancouverensis]|uniref:histidine kinase n=1 Tax=Candidatus Nitrohelix vancouverensis TaxID=2705534 RepID=A0A7T0G3Q9_9BACT|nr:MAG: response regulator [Candidatus Nitrohelix vancouverensis]